MKPASVLRTARSRAVKNTLARRQFSCAPMKCWAGHRRDLGGAHGKTPVHLPYSSAPVGGRGWQCLDLGGACQRWLLACIAVLWGACAPAMAASETAPAHGTRHVAVTLTPDKPVVLLGEVHDHPQQHALRLAAFDAWLARGGRPALVMEQFDIEQQPQIDRLRAEKIDALAATDPAAAARELTRQLGRPGWTWRFYEPFIERALHHGLPLVAANLPRTALRPVMQDGLAAHGFDPRVPEPVMQAQARLIEASHCGMVDAALARRMALAQIARDQAMARAVEAHAARGVLLLAGNGHVRTDLGAPLWLSAATRALSQAIGVLEEGDETTAFDVRVMTPTHPRQDPCAGIRRPGAWSNPSR